MLTVRAPAPERLEDYVDLLPTDATGRAAQGFHVGGVHMAVASTAPNELAEIHYLLGANKGLRVAIVVGVGGHNVYGLAAALKASAVVCVDLNIVQAVHHGIFRRHVAQQRDCLQQGSVQAETTRVWRTLLDAQAPEGFTAYLGEKQKGCIYRHSAATLLDDIYQQEACGLTGEAMDHIQQLAELRRIYTAVADICDLKQMQAVGNLVDGIDTRLMGDKPSIIRRLPVVFYGANALSFSAPGEEEDFCGRPNSLEKWFNGHWAIHDLVFGVHGRSRGVVIEVERDEGRISLKGASEMQGFLYPEEDRPTRGFLSVRQWPQRRAG